MKVSDLLSLNSGGTAAASCLTSYATPNWVPLQGRYHAKGRLKVLSFRVSV